MTGREDEYDYLFKGEYHVTTLPEQLTFKRAPVCRLQMLHVSFLTGSLLFFTLKHRLAHSTCGLQHCNLQFQTAQSWSIAGRPEKKQLA